MVLSCSARPGKNVLTNASMGVDKHYYKNRAVASVSRLCLASGKGHFVHVDIVESISGSPFAPILLFDLSHLRAAVWKEGFVDFHPRWRGEKLQ